jgi:hypothetical protein
MVALVGNEQDAALGYIRPPSLGLLANIGHLK